MVFTEKYFSIGKFLQFFFSFSDPSLLVVQVADPILNLKFPFGASVYV